MLEKLNHHPRPVNSPVTHLRRPRPLRFESLKGRDLMAGQISKQIPVELSDLDQFTLELINRARGNPQAESARHCIGLNDELVSPDLISLVAKEPLAPHSLLGAVAMRHSKDMIDRDCFAHDAKEQIGRLRSKLQLQCDPISL